MQFEQTGKRRTEEGRSHGGGREEIRLRQKERSVDTFLIYPSESTGKKGICLGGTSAQSFENTQKDARHCGGAELDGSLPLAGDEADIPRA